MSETTSSEPTTAHPQADGTDGTSSRTDGSGSGSTHGRTTIADTVVAKIAGIATREVDGVYDLGGATERVVGLVRNQISVASPNLSQGVSVEVGEREASVDLQITAEYGVSLADLAEGIRSNVISSIEGMTGLTVTEVNVTIGDVHLDEGDVPELPAHHSDDDSDATQPASLVQDRGVTARAR